VAQKYIYQLSTIFIKIFNEIKDIRGSFLALGLPYLTSAPVVPPQALVEPATDTIKLTTITFMSKAGYGIESGPSACESSALPPEPPNARKNTYIFSSYIVNIRAYYMLQFNLPSFMIKI